MAGGLNAQMRPGNTKANATGEADGKRRGRRMASDGEGAEGGRGFPRAECARGHRIRARGPGGRGQGCGPRRFLPGAKGTVLSAAQRRSEAGNRRLRGGLWRVVGGVDVAQDVLQVRLLLRREGFGPVHAVADQQVPVLGGVRGFGHAFPHVPVFVAVKRRTVPKYVLQRAAGVPCGAGGKLMTGRADHQVTGQGHSGASVRRTGGAESEMLHERRLGIGRQQLAVDRRRLNFFQYPLEAAAPSQICLLQKPHALNYRLH